MIKKLPVIMMLVSLISQIILSATVSFAEVIDNNQSISLRKVDLGDAQEQVPLTLELTANGNQEQEISLKVPDIVVFDEAKTKEANVETQQVLSYDATQHELLLESNNNQPYYLVFVPQQVGVVQFIAESKTFDSQSNIIEVDISGVDKEKTMESLEGSLENEGTELSSPSEKVVNKTQESQKGSELSSQEANTERKAEFPPIPTGTVPIDIEGLFNFTGNYIYQPNFVYNMTGQGRTSTQAWSKDYYDLTRAFEVEFYTYLGDARTEGTADGIALAFHNNPNFTVGEGGSGMGIYSHQLGKANVLEFDTYFNDKVNSQSTLDDDEDIVNTQVTNVNGNPNDPANPLTNHVGHIAIRESDANGYVSKHRLLQMGTVADPIANGEWRQVNVKWDPKTSTLSGHIGSIAFEEQYDLTSTLANPKDVTWGITSSTAIYETLQGIFFTKINLAPSNSGVLETEKQVDKEQVKPGDKVTYTIIAKNIEPDSILTNVVVEDEIPEGLQFVPGSLKLDGEVATNEGTNGKLKVTIPEIQGVGEKKVSFEATVTQETNGNIKNVAVVTDPVDPENPQEPEVPIEVIDAPGKLETDKVADLEYVKPGEIVTYTITAKNIKENTVLKDVVVSDDIVTINGIELIENSVQLDGQDVTNEVSDGNVKVTIPKIEGNQEVKISFKVKVTQQTNGTIKNIATVVDPADPTPQKPSEEIDVVEVPGELETEKKVDQSTVKPGDQITYTIVVKNIKDSSLISHVKVEDKLPAGLKLIADSTRIDGKLVVNEVADGNVQVTVPFIKGVGQREVSFKVEVTQNVAGAIKNTAIVTDPADPATPQEPEVDIEVNDVPGELKATKSVSQATVKPGDIISYAIVAENVKATSVITQVKVADTLPDGIELIHDEDHPITRDGRPVLNEVEDGNIQVTIPFIKGNAQSEIKFYVKVTQAFNGEIENVATVTDPGDPENPQKPTIPIEVVDAPGKLEAIKEVDQEFVKPGETVTYTITARNILDKTVLKDVIVTDDIPEGLELVANSIKLDGENVANEDNTGNVKVTIPEIKGIGEKKVSFKARVTKETNGTIKNVAVVTDPEDPTNPEEPEVPIEVIGVPGELEAVKEVSQEQVKPGETITYTITAKNIKENSLLTQVKVFDELPEGLELVEGSVQLDGKSVLNEVADGNVQVTIANIKGIGEKKVSFKAKVTRETNGTIKNVAVVTDPEDPTNPEEPEVPIDVIGVPGELEAVKEVSQEQVKPGEIVTYTITAKNIKENSLLTQVKVFDELPEGLELVEGSVQLDGRNVLNEVADGNVQVTIANIKGIGEKKVSFKAKVTRETNGTIKNVAVVTDPEDPTNPEEPEVPVDVIGVPGELEATKEVNQEQVKPGETVTYTITAKNIKENSLLTQVKVFDELPEGLELIPNSVQLDGKTIPNEVADGNVQVTIANIKGIGEKKVSFKAKVTRETNGTIKNVAVVTDPEDPTNPEEPEVPIDVIGVPGELEAVKEVSQEQAKPDETVTYTITAKNIKENSLLTQVKVFDELPEGLELIPDSVQLDGKAVLNEVEDGNIQVTIANIKGIGEKKVSFKAKVTKETNGTIKNVAVVTDPEDPTNPEEPEVPVDVIGVPGELEATKEVSQEQVKPGETVTYTITAKNIKENSLLTQVKVFDELPEGLELIPDSLQLDGKTVPNEVEDSNVQVTIANIKGIGEKKVSFKAKVMKETNGTIKNVAVVTDPENPTNPEEPEVPIDVIGIPGELEATKEVSQEQVKPGETVTYTITAKNTKENSLLTQVKVLDEIPEGLELVAGSVLLDGKPVLNEVEDGNVQVTIANIKGIGEKQVSFKAKVTRETNGTIKNVAVVTDPEDPTNPEEPEVPIDVIGVPGELEATKEVSHEQVKPGETVTYTITAKNIKENSLLTQVKVVDELPEGLELVEGSLQLEGRPIANEVADGNVQVTIANIKGVGEKKVSFKAKVTKGTNGVIKNVAVVTDPEDPTNPEEPEVPVEVIDAPGKLAAEKLANQEQVKVGDIVTYTIVAKNVIEGTKLKNVTIVDSLPVEVKFVKDSLLLDGQSVENEGDDKTIKVTIPEITGIGEKKLTFQVEVTKGAKDRIKNVAIVSDSAHPEDPIKPQNEIKVIQDKDKFPIPSLGSDQNELMVVIGVLLTGVVYFYRKHRLKMGK